MFGWFKNKKPPSNRQEDSSSEFSRQQIYDIGEQIGGDFIVRRVMQGGLGFVYVVDDKDGDRFILKCAKNPNDPSVRSVFLEEAKTWVQLGFHPNLVPALWVDEIAGQLFVSAELVESDQENRVSLRDYLNFGALSDQATAVFALDFCYGIEFAISKGLVSHRDIKPENMLIGAAGTLRITDFGLSRAATPSNDVSDKSILHLGVWNDGDRAVSGTPYYMSPEQWEGLPQDFRTDIYAFGVVMYEMQYGSRPFNGRTIDEIKNHQKSGVPKFNGRIFDDIIERCVSINVSKRYSTPSELAQDIISVCREHQLRLPPKPDQEQSGFKLNELRTKAQSLATFGKLDEAIDAVHQVIAISRTNAKDWTQLGRLSLERGDVDGAYEATKRSISIDATRSPAWNNLGLIKKRMGDMEGATNALFKALECDPLNTGAMANLSEPLGALGRSEEAIRHLKRAAEVAPDKYIIWTNLGAVYIGVGDGKQALKCIETAKSISPEAHLSHLEDMLRAANEIIENETESPSDYIRRELLEALSHSPNDLKALHNLGLFYIEQNAYEAAASIFEKAFEVNDENAFAVCRLIEVYAATRNIAKIDEWCDTLSTIPGGEVPSLAFHARTLAHCGEIDRARKIVFAAQLKLSGEAEIQIALGDVLMYSDDVVAEAVLAVRAYTIGINILRKEGASREYIQEIRGRLMEAQVKKTKLLKEQNKQEAFDI